VPERAGGGFPPIPAVNAGRADPAVVNLADNFGERPSLGKMPISGDSGGDRKLDRD
jgi:hypothetical protein